MKVNRSASFVDFPVYRTIIYQINISCASVSPDPPSPFNIFQILASQSFLRRGIHYTKTKNYGNDIYNNCIIQLYVTCILPPVEGILFEFRDKEAPHSLVGYQPISTEKDKFIKKYY